MSFEMTLVDQDNSLTFASRVTLLSTKSMKVPEKLRNATFDPITRNITRLPFLLLSH